MLTKLTPLAIIAAVAAIGCATDDEGIDAQTGPVVATYLGVTTILITDGETSLMTDGFFTRDGMVAGLLDGLSPDSEAVTEALERLEVDELDAVLVAHSHLDHALDSPEVALQTGAMLVGSRSTLNIGRGWALGEEQMIEVSSGEPLKFGQFTVTFVRSMHSTQDCPDDPYVTEHIEEPIEFPVGIDELLEGGSYTIHIAHPRGSLIVQASSGHLPGALQDYDAEVVFLGTAWLGNYDEPCQEDYFSEVVEAVNGSWVIPVHWDNWLLPLDQPLEPWGIVDDFDGAIEFLEAKMSDGRFDQLTIPEGWQEMVLFEE